MTNRAEILKQKFEDVMGLPFQELLGQDFIEQILKEQGVNYRNSIYTPVVTIWAWLSQVLDNDKSLRNTVGRILFWLGESNAELPSVDTGAYTKARQRLPSSVLEETLAESAQQLQGLVPPENYWCGHRLQAFDGTTISMEDTPANQKSYPQPNTQKLGCGFPLVRLVAWFCVVTGAILSIAIAPYLTSEWELSRLMYKLLKPGDLVVADSAYGTYVDLALVKENLADAVFHKHHARNTDFLQGERLGKGDHIVTWQKPNKCPDAMSREDFMTLPESMEVREVEISIEQKGFRPKKIILVTTLLDSKRYSKVKLAELYRLRWSSTEVNFKHIKTTLKMEKIAAKTPDVVRKDIIVHLIAYNLLRAVMIEAVISTDLSPLRLSLQGTRQHFNHFKSSVSGACNTEIKRLYKVLLSIVYCEWIPFRPDRAEPRVVKRRPKAFPRMQQPRFTLKANLAR
jgi:Transposase DDE domain